MKPEAILVPPGLFSHEFLHHVGLLPADLTDLVHLDCRGFRNRLK